MSSTIVKAHLEHLPILAPLFDGYRRFYRKPGDLPGAEAFIKARLTNGDSLILLAHDQALQGLGFTQLYPSFSSVRMRPIWVLNDLYVAPEARRMGVGRQLMEAARHEAQAANVAMLSLATEKNNTKAKALYESLGYETDTAFDYYELMV